MINEKISLRFFNSRENMKPIDAQTLDILIGGFEVIGIEKIDDTERELVFMYLRNKSNETIALQFNSYQDEAGPKINIVVCRPDLDEADLDLCE